MSPQTGQGCPVRPCTRSPSFFSAFSSPAASPRERSTASRSVLPSASYSRAVSSSVSPDASLYGDIRAACSTSSE